MRSPVDLRVEAAIAEASRGVGLWIRGSKEPWWPMVQDTGRFEAHLHLAFGKMRPDARAYLRKLLANVPKPRRKRGRYVKGQNESRDDMIVSAIDEALATLGPDFDATRGRESLTPWTGCRVVREALARNGVHISESRIETIWNKRRPR